MEGEKFEIAAATPLRKRPWYASVDQVTEVSRKKASLHTLRSKEA